MGLLNSAEARGIDLIVFVGLRVWLDKVLGEVKVCVRFGGGMNFVVSVPNPVGRKLSIDLRTGGSGGCGLDIDMLARTSTVSRRGGSPGRSSGKSLLICIRLNGGCFFV